MAKPLLFGCQSLLISVNDCHSKAVKNKILRLGGVKIVFTRQAKITLRGNKIRIG